MGQTKSDYLKIFIIFGISLQPPLAKAGMPTSEIVLTEMTPTILDHDVVAQTDFLLISHDSRNIVNITFTYKRIMEKLNMRLKVDFERPDKARLQMLDITTDMCEMMTGKLSKQKFLQGIVKEFARLEKFPYECPLDANRTYSLVNFSLRMPQFPLPKLKFIATCVVLDETGKRKLSEIRVRGVTKLV